MAWTSAIWIVLGIAFIVCMALVCGGMMRGNKTGSGGGCGGGGCGDGGGDREAPHPEGEVVYTCPMHPGVRQSSPGKCPKCGMDLVRK